MAAALLATFTIAPMPTVAEAIKIGMSRIVAQSPIYIAQERGYFAAEGLQAEIVFFAAGVPAIVGVVAGALDIGAAGMSGTLYNLAAQGEIRIIAGGVEEVPGFRAQTWVASNRAYEAGLKSFKDLPGHSFAVTQVGSPSLYYLSLVAEKYHLDLKAIRILPLQSLPNAVSALIGGQAEAGNLPYDLVLPAIQRGQVKLLGFVSDETPCQGTMLVIAAKPSREKGDAIERFLRAYRKGAHDYLDAFVGSNGRRRNGPTAQDVLAITAKYVGQSVEELEPAMPYIDADGRLDVKDIRRQAAWYKSEGMVKGDVDADAIIDKRYVIPLPERG